jgi:class 3 adenylate cyclase
VRERLSDYRLRRAIGAIDLAAFGAIVKTAGDAVMATFRTPDRALAAALRMREAIGTLNDGRTANELLLKIGIREGRVSPL